MSTYTTEVRYICEKYAGYSESKDYRDFNTTTEKYLSEVYNIDDIIDKAIPRIFEPDIELFDPGYKNVLFHKILRHYYMREIGAETVALWKFYLNTTLKEILPLYNQRYKSELIKFDPMFDTDMTTTQNKKSDGNVGVSGNVTDKGDKAFSEQGNSTQSEIGNETETNKSKTTTADKAKTTNEGETTTHGTNSSNTTKNETNLYADTPQGGIQGLLGHAQGESGNDYKYLTDARKIDGTEKVQGENDANGTSTGTTEYTDDITVDLDGTKTNDTTINADSESHRSGTETNNNSRTTREDTVSTSTEDYIMHVAGKNGGKSYSEMLKEFRETFLNIDMEIINELRPCFMQLW